MNKLEKILIALGVVGSLSAPLIKDKTISLATMGGQQARHWYYL